MLEQFLALRACGFYEQALLVLVRDEAETSHMSAHPLIRPSRDSA